MGMVGLFWGGLDICTFVTALAVLHTWHLPTGWGHSLEGGPRGLRRSRKRETEAILSH